MAEMRVTHLVAGGLLIGAVVVVGLACAGIVSIGPLNQKNLIGWWDTGAATVGGYTPAKTPTEAMDKFREAIQNRKYKVAARYCTKPYAEQLVRANDGAVALGEEIDRIERYADNKQIKTEKLGYFLHQLDPFPRNFKAGAAPEQKGDKAYGVYVLEPMLLKAMPTEMADMDQNMFVTVLRPPAIFANRIELVKEGEEWKLNIPTNAAFETSVGYFKDHWKTYHTGLHSLADDLARERWDTKAGLERDIIHKMREAK